MRKLDSDPAEKTEPHDLQPVIELSGVKKNFGRQMVLRGIDLRVMRGETLVIIGASGEGKSIIIKHMLGLMRPDQGTVRVLGKDLSRLSRRQMDEVRRDFGVLFQNAALFDSMTVYDNVALPLREKTRMKEAEIRSKVIDQLTVMGIDAAAEKFPAQLSGGMRKRVGLARALVLNPQVVFFDEPTTGLDVNKGNELYRLFYHSQRQFGYTAVIVSHDVPKVFKLADQVALLADGIIQGCMTPANFFISEQPVIKAFVAEALEELDIPETEEGD